ncbi:unnamed protein product [Notodromas monacha]|uniref:BTB domain-containing protein n=1 Tax=Notodromas monacha TaxID=399045 RepID=A0A7R9G805_9CRUS|nr:unnamed protein product [Notodromas monacha]CAG0912770.1 unnamed protein product [Notodromas monacha]
MDPSSLRRLLPAGIEILGTQQQQQDQRHLLHQFPDEMWTALSRLCCDTNSELHQVSAADGRIVVALADSVNIIEETSGFGDEEEEEEEEEHGRELKKLDDSVFSSGGGQDMQQQQHHIIKLGPQFSMWPTRHSTVGTQTIMSQTAMQMKPSGRFLLQPQMPKELMMEPGLGSSLMHLHHLPSIRSSAGSGGAGGGGKLDLPTQIWRLFQRGKFCDFTVYTNNTDSHRCHKAVLCLLSDYFQDLLLMGTRQEGLPHPAAAALAGDESRISLDQDGRIVVALADSVNIIEETSGFGDEEEEEEEEEHGRELKKLDDSVFSSGGGGQDMQQQQHHIIKLGPQFSMWPTRHSTVGTQTIMSQTAMQMKPSGRFLLQPQMPNELMMEPGLGSSLMHLHHLPSIRSSAGSGGASGGGKLDLPTQIWRLFQRGKFCDFTVYTNNTDSHRCHKAVLCLLSDYFQDLLLMGARQEGLPHPAAAALAGDESRISLDQSWMSTEMFRAFLGWCYAADAEEAAHLINEESVACLSECFSFHHALIKNTELKQQCYQFISTVTHHEASGTVQQQQVPKVTTLTGPQQQQQPPTRHPVLGKWTPPENKETIITSGSGHHHQQGYLMGQQDTDDPYCRHRYNKAQITRQQQLPCPPDDNIDPPELLPMMTSYYRDERANLADGTCGNNSCCWRPGLNAAAAAAPKIFSRDEGDNGNKPPKWMHRNKSTHPGCGPCCSHQQQKVGQHILGFCRQHHQQHSSTRKNNFNNNTSSIHLQQAQFITAPPQV